MRRIGLFGGSFDPVHNAHVALAGSALDALRLDELRWLPAGQAWQKERLHASSEHRVAMLRLAIGDTAHHHLELCEVNRTGPSYMIDTVLELNAHDPSAQWLLIMGQDQLTRLPTWHRWRELVALVTLAVASRPGSPRRKPGDVLAQGTQVLEVPFSPTLISSSDIRAKVATHQSIAQLVPTDVANYIETNHLYRNPNRN